MVAVTIAWGPRECRDDDVRPKRAHHRNHIAQYRILRPMLPRLIRSFREAEIVFAPEILMGPVDPARREQLLGANDAERFTELVADEILSAVSASQRHVSRVDISAAREPRDQIGVFVVRMSGDPEHAHLLSVGSSIQNGHGMSGE